MGVVDSLISLEWIPTSPLGFAVAFLALVFSYLFFWYDPPEPSYHHYPEESVLLEDAIGMMYPDAAKHRYEVMGGSNYPFSCVHVVHCTEKPVRKHNTAGSNIVQLSDKNCPAHWFYVTYGFAAHGSSRELCFRLACTSGEEKAPPEWPVKLLTNACASMMSSKRFFRPNEVVTNLAFPDECRPKNKFTGVLVTTDPLLDEVMYTNDGPVEFLHLLSLLENERLTCLEWSAWGYGQMVSRENPLLVSYMDKKSVLLDKHFAAEVDVRKKKEGCLHEYVYVSNPLSWVVSDDEERVRVTVNVQAAAEISRLLKGRIEDGREFTLITEQKGDAIRFEPDDVFDWDIEIDPAGQHTLLIYVPEEVAEGMEGLLKKLPAAGGVLDLGPKLSLSFVSSMSAHHHSPHESETNKVDGEVEEEERGKASEETEEEEEEEDSGKQEKMGETGSQDVATEQEGITGG